MHRLLAVAASFVVAASLSGTALAAPPTAAQPAAPAKPLRTLVYDVSYTAHTLHEQKTSGFNSSFGNGMQSAGNVGVGAGNGTAAAGLDGDHTGTLTIDVVAATKDGGLVVDTSFNGSVATSGKTRIAIFPDGRLSAPPTAEIGPETLHILPLLARGFFATADMAPGATWVGHEPPPATGSTTYRVEKLDGTLATIGVEGTVTATGINGFRESDHGTTVYATDLDDPTSLDLLTHIERTPSMGELLTTDGHLVVRLVSDTFAKK